MRGRPFALTNINPVPLPAWKGLGLGAGVDQHFVVLAVLVHPSSSCVIPSEAEGPGLLDASRPHPTGSSAACDARASFRCIVSFQRNDRISAPSYSPLLYGEGRRGAAPVGEGAAVQPTSAHVCCLSFCVMSLSSHSKILTNRLSQRLNRVLARPHPLESPLFSGSRRDRPIAAALIPFPTRQSFRKNS